MSDYPKKIRITVYLENGEAIQGEPITIHNEHMEAHWANAFRTPKELKYLALTQVNALGDVDNIYINPTFITHVRVADVKE
jgi:hypothetical protein